jgi:hypothetical protein
MLEQQPPKKETEHEEKIPPTSQINENVTATGEAQDDTGAGEHEEKSPPTDTNLSSDNQQLEGNESGLEEKVPLNI